MVADNFPRKSSEFKTGTPKYNEYITALQKVCNTHRIPMLAKQQIQHQTTSLMALSQIY